MSYFPESYNHSKEIKLSNYSAVSDLKGQRGIDTSKFAKKVNLAALK